MIVSSFSSIRHAHSLTLILGALSFCMPNQARKWNRASDFGVNLSNPEHEKSATEILEA